MLPHGRHKRNTQARRLGGAAEAHGHGLLAAHALHGEEAPEEGGEVPLGEGAVGEAWVDGCGEALGRAGDVEAEGCEEEVDGDVEEDVVEDGGGG